jgi:hypothetical protein
MSRSRTTLLTIAFALAFSFTLSAAEWVVPAAAHTAGVNNTNWRTDLRIVNPGSSAADATLYLLPQDSDNGARSQHVALSIPPLGQLSVTDVLAAKFNFTGSAALLVDSSQTALVVASRTYNQAASGATYGQFIPGVPVTQALKANEIGQLIYVSKSDDYRTNVGFANVTALHTAVSIALYDGNNAVLGSKAFDLLPYGQIQVNDVFAAVGAAPAAVARAEVTSGTDTVAYCSVIDNHTGDPIALIAQRPADAQTDLFVAAAAHTAGANDSLWRSDVRVFNASAGGGDDAGPGTATLTLSYYPANVANAAPVTKVMSLGGFQVLALDDVLSKTFGLTNATGALRFQSSQKLLVSSRTYNQSSAGTFGQDVPGLPLTSALTTGAVARFPGLTNTGYRANVGFFNASASATDLALELISESGTSLGRKTLHLDANMMTQVNSLFAYLGVTGDVAGASLTIGTSSGTVLAYVSVIDNASGDAVYVPGAIGLPSSPVPPGGAGNCVTVSLIAPGRKSVHRVTDASGGLLWTMDTTYVSDSLTDGVESAVAHTAGGDSKIDSHFTFIAQNGLRSLTRSVSQATTSAAGFDILVTTDSTFSTPMPIGPLSDWCAGATWAIPATTQTVVIGGTVPGPTQVINRPANTGSITAVNETVTVAAGTFQTVHYRGVQGITDPKVQATNVWITMDGIVVKEEDLDSTGNVTARVELTSLQ